MSSGWSKVEGHVRWVEHRRGACQVGGVQERGMSGRWSMEQVVKWIGYGKGVCQVGGVLKGVCQVGRMC